MISVIIPAYNEEKLIARTLESLSRQKTSRAYEIILVNNASTDRTEEIAKTFLKKMPLRIIDQPEKGRGCARWIGAENAKGDILLSTDADVIVPTNWIETVGQHFDNPDVNAITGLARITDNNAFTNFCFNYGIYGVTFLYRFFVGHFWFAGFNFAVRKEIYKKAGGFNKKLNATEDCDLAFRVCKIAKIELKTDITILVSGRRMNNNAFKGLASYSHSYFQYLLYRKRYSYLNDIR